MAFWPADGGLIPHDKGNARDHSCWLQEKIRKRMRKRWTGTICIMYTLAIRLDHHVFLAVCLKPRLREGGGEYRFTCSKKEFLSVSFLLFRLDAA